MVFFNTSLGLPFKCEKIAKPDYEVLYNKEKKYDRGVIPKDVTFILASCDVQGDRLEFSLLATIEKRPM